MTFYYSKISEKENNKENVSILQAKVCSLLSNNKQLCFSIIQGYTIA